MRVCHTWEKVIVKRKRRRPPFNLKACSTTFKAAPFFGGQKSTPLVVLRTRTQTLVFYVHTICNHSHRYGSQSSHIHPLFLLPIHKGTRNVMFDELRNTMIKWRSTTTSPVEFKHKRMANDQFLDDEKTRKSLSNFSTSPPLPCTCQVEFLLVPFTARCSP